MESAQRDQTIILKRACGTFILIVCVMFSLCAQLMNDPDVRGGLYSLDFPGDARSCSMGESFVALPGNIAASMYNPAGLSGLEGIHVFYGNRNIEDNRGIPDYNYRFISVAAHLSSIDIGFSYSRSSGYNYGYDHMLALTAAKNISDRLSIGVSIKSYDVIRNFPSSSSHYLQTSLPLLADLGILFQQNGILNKESVHDRITFGASLQNFGTDYRGKETSSGIVTEGLILLPRYLRLGFTYSFALLHDSDYRYDPLSILITGEYRNLLNAYPNNGKDFWGFGMETKFFDLVALRLGGFTQPYESINGTRGLPALRYGLGLNLPLSRLGVDEPLTVKLDYSGMPQQFSFEYALTNQKVLSIEVVYNIEI